LKKKYFSSHMLPKEQLTSFWSQGILGVKQILKIKIDIGNIVLKIWQGNSEFERAAWASSLPKESGQYRLLPQFSSHCKSLDTSQQSFQPWEHKYNSPSVSSHLTLDTIPCLSDIQHAWAAGPPVTDMPQASLIATVTSNNCWVTDNQNQTLQQFNKL
jgi:hypothetical protein